MTKGRSPCGNVDWNSRIIWLYTSRTVVPLVGTWIEIGKSRFGEVGFSSSFPLWERGLKSSVLTEGNIFRRRSPCGNVDWNLNGLVAESTIGVVPRVGTWIEILRFLIGSTASGRSPCGNVDWNVKIYFPWPPAIVVPLVGTWIEMLLGSMAEYVVTVVPLVGTWIEINPPIKAGTLETVVPLVGTWIEICGVPWYIIIGLSFPLWERGLKSA